MPKIKNKWNKYVTRNGDHYRKSGSSNYLVASIYSLAEFKIMKLVEAVKLLSPYSKNWVIWKFVFSKMLGMIFLFLLRRVNPSSENLGHKRRKQKEVSLSFLQLQSELSVFWKSSSLVSSFTPIVLWQSKILFAVGLINFKISNLKMLRDFELRILESNSFHSTMVDGKNKFSKKLVLHIDMEDIVCISSSIVTI